MILDLNLTLPMCLMFGSIIAPTDPIAATSILKKSLDARKKPELFYVVQSENEARLGGNQ